MTREEMLPRFLRDVSRHVTQAYDREKLLIPAIYKFLAVRRSTSL